MLCILTCNERAISLQGLNQYIPPNMSVKFGMIVTRGVECMATTSPPLARERTPALLPAIARLAWWRFKRSWHVLLVTWLGMVTMVMLVCAVPLFSQVAMTAGVRNALNSAPPYEQRITFTLASSQPTTAQIHQAGQS